MSARKYCGSMKGELNASREARCTLPLENGNRHHQAVSREPENEAVMVSPIVTSLLNIKSCCIPRTCSTAEASRPPREPEAADSAYAVSFALTSFATAVFSGPKRSSALPKVAYVAYPVTLSVPSKTRLLFGCSCKFSPTPGRSIMVSKPRSLRILKKLQCQYLPNILEAETHRGLPIPDISRSKGVRRAPEERITSLSAPTVTV